MKELTLKVKNLLSKQHEWTIATIGTDGPNAVPVFFTSVLECGRLIIADVFMNKTINNIKKDNRVAITVYGEKMEGYQIKGTAEYFTSGEAFDKMAEIVASKGLKAKGLVMVTPEVIYVTTPGPDNGKTL